jgi:hypothetical protein
MNRVSLAAAVAAALSVAVPAALAQSTGIADAPETVAQAAPSAEHGPHHGARDQRALRMPSERMEARLASIHKTLNITDAQQAQWEDFANVLRKHARDMDQRIQSRMAQRGEPGARTPERPQVSAIERLERQQQRLAQRSARLDEVLTAAKPLYAALSPEQKQLADQMLSRDGERRGHRGQHRHHHHRGMHQGA